MIPFDEVKVLDRNAQYLGIPTSQLMENAGKAVADHVMKRYNLAHKKVTVICGNGNNGGDGFVAARWLARSGLPTVAVLVSGGNRPGTPEAARNWDRLASEPTVDRIHASTARDVAILAQGVEKASVVVDALLGTGVRGALREPVRSAVDLVRRAREAQVPVVSVDTPTAVDLTSGEPSDPAVRADLTVTFHRPKTGLLTTRGAALAGRVLVAPIGIPPEADRG